MYFLTLTFSFQLVEFYTQTSDLKHSIQAAQLNNLLDLCYASDKPSCRYFTLTNYNIFQYWVETQLVASLFINKQTYFVNKTSKLVDNPKTKTVLEIYSIAVHPDFRNKKLCTRLIFESLERMKSKFNLNDFYVTLHLNPNDPMMAVSFAIYMNLNFKKAVFVKTSPADLQFKARFGKLESVVDCVQRNLKSGSVGLYLAMYGKYSQLRQRSIDKYSLIKLGKVLQNRMLKVHETSKLEEE